MDETYLSSPRCAAKQPSIFQGGLHPDELNPIPFQEAYNTSTWNTYTRTTAPTGNPTTPPNTSGSHRDTEETPGPAPRAHEVLSNSKIRETGETDLED